MSSWRHETLGDQIDRGTVLSFTFDGHTVSGFKGDTLASALSGAGVRIMGRSFKYHRPRGLWGMAADEPNAIFDVQVGAKHLTNQRGTTTPLQDGMVVQSVNARPTAARDRFGLLDRLHRFLPAGFYYKTFMALGWDRYEPMIRRMAGLGQIDPDFAPPADTPQLNTRCDLLVVGAGPAGLAAARSSAMAGRRVWLVDDGESPGGSLLRRGGQINGKPWAEFAAETCDLVRETGGRVMMRTTIWGMFDHGLCAAWMRTPDGKDRHLRIRTQDCVVAAGAIERPLWFANNDLPGVMSCEAALHLLVRHGVVAGKTIVLATANDASYPVAQALVAAGAKVTLVDQRGATQTLPGVRHIHGATVQGARGKTSVVAATVNGRDIRCDTILCSGGYTPTVHLWCQSGGKLDWNADQDALVPRPGTSDVVPVGAAKGAFGLQAALSSGHGAFSQTDAPSCDGSAFGAQAAMRPDPTLPGRQWVDLQNDVTLKDVGLAAREGYTSVEHLKRYTTLGMANDQGRSSNFGGLAAMAAVTGRTIPETGTTTYRPPFEPLPLSVIAGRRRGALFNPPKRLVLEPAYRAMGAQFREYGGWVRPSVYGAGDEAALVQQEAKVARETAAVFDASPLGKLEVAGPGAAQLLDFTGYMRLSTLKPGRARYGFMLSESGIVYDDGVVLRLGENRFIVSASSSHVDGVRARLEDARQDRIGHQNVFIHDVTQGLATLTVTGPKAGQVMQAAGMTGIALTHMGVQETRMDGYVLRIARISFTGDQSYELTVPVRHAATLKAKLDTALKAVGGRWIGLEAVMILRAEKGYVLIGKDTDGNTMPQDLGWPGPMHKRGDEFLGKRALFTPEGLSDRRRQLIGLRVPDGAPPLVTGAHLVPADGARRSLGFVTSSYDSPTLKHPIALALMERGQAQMGQDVLCFNNGQVRPATVTPACAFDPDGGRLHG